MAIIVMNGLSDVVQKKKVELVKMNGKYYIELDEFEDTECIIELSISLAHQNDLLIERIRVLEEKIKMLDENNG